MHTASTNHPPQQLKLADFIPPEQWAVFLRVIEAGRRRNVPFAFGGGTAFSYYSNRWRNSKDADFYLLPDDRLAMIDAVTEAGLVDYHNEAPYDRGWIYRARSPDGIIVDLIWQMANYRAQVDLRWLTAGAETDIRGTSLRMIPVEELIWAKLYVFQRDRCDWTDLCNILFVRGEHLNWSHLIGRVGPDRRILAALVEIFTWMCPGRAERFPASLWETLGIGPPQPGQDEVSLDRVRMADSRDWFGPNIPPDP